MSTFQHILSAKNVQDILIDNNYNVFESLVKRMDLYLIADSRIEMKPFAVLKETDVVQYTLLKIALTHTIHIK
jgi:hypothetical protein